MHFVVCFCFYQSQRTHDKNSILMTLFHKNSIKSIFLKLKIYLGEGNFSTDEWAANVPAEWIEQVLDYCDGFDNRYLFQSKNPARFLEYLDHPVMRKSVLCTTIETNRFYPDIMRNAPLPRERAITMQEIANYGIPNLRNL